MSDEIKPKLVFCCPNCKIKVNKVMWRKLKQKYICFRCLHEFSHDEAGKRPANFFEEVVGFRTVKSRLMDENSGKMLNEFVEEQVPRVRRGRKPFNTAMAEKFKRDNLLAMIKERFFSSKAIYERNPSKTKQHYRDAAFIAFLFLTGARITEVVGIKLKKGDGWEYVLDPIKKSQISLYRLKSRGEIVWRVSNMPVLKRRKEIKYIPTGEVIKRVLPTRNVILPYRLEKEFINIVHNWTKYLKDDEIVFKFGSNRAFHICDLFYESYPHFWRHIRASDLVQTFNFNSIQQQHFFGWTSAKMAETYSHLNLTALLDGMLSGYDKNRIEKIEPDDLGTI